jgi:mercuric ion transport protein
MSRATLTGLGGLVAAFLGSLCCVGPLLFVTFGVGAGLASTFEPLRPLFGALMAALLAAGFWSVYGGRSMRTSSAVPADAPSVDGDPTCAPDAACAVPTRRRRDVAILWSATLLALVFWTFPTWSRWLV